MPTNDNNRRNDALDAARYRKLKAQPQSWMLEYMRASRPHGNTLDAALDALPPISPNAGSEARKAELRAAQDDGHDCAIRYVLGYLNGAGDCGSTYYEEILNSCGRDRIIKSAIADGELEFTGLAEYIKRDGTRAEKRRVRAALRAQAQASDAEVRP